MELNAISSPGDISRSSKCELENRQRPDMVVPPTSHFSQSILDMLKLFM